MEWQHDSQATLAWLLEEVANLAKFHQYEGLAIPAMLPTTILVKTKGKFTAFR